jgi:hypothetical protein
MRTLVSGQALYDHYSVSSWPTGLYLGRSPVLRWPRATVLPVIKGIPVRGERGPTRRGKKNSSAWKNK